MKVIISHDVDHITAIEHYKDLFIPKFIARNTIDFLKWKIGFFEYCFRLSNILKNRLHNIDQLVSFDKANHVKPTFFFGVNNGLNLSYSNRNAKRWIDYVVNQGLQVGVHGIEYNNQDSINQEFLKFKNLLGNNPMGIRMHYLRSDSNTLNYLNHTGYLFDASEYKFKPPYKFKDIWEFPIHIMDSSIIHGETQYQVKTLEQAKNETIACIGRAEMANFQYLHIVTHDIYFSVSFKTAKAWYIWLVEYLVSNEYEFIDYSEAVNRLNQ